MQTTLSGAVLLGIGGIAFIAWHDPGIYRRMVQPMLGIVTITMGGYTVWILSYQAGFIAANNAVRELNAGEFVDTASLDGNPFLAMGIFVAAFIYLLGLWTLADSRAQGPTFAKKEEPPDANKPPG